MASLHHVTAPQDTDLKEAVLSEFMFVDAKIIVEDDLTVDAPERAMMDSGALQASFIRADVLERIPYLKTLEKPSQYTITLGDGENTVSSSTTVTINIILPNAQGKEKRIEQLTFIVMPKLSCPIIIGLPHIVKKIPSIFMSHFVAAMASAHQLELQQQNLQVLDSNTAGKNKQSYATDITILNLNANGYTSAVKKGLLLYLQSTPHDVLILTEVKLVTSKLQATKDQLYAIGYKFVSINSNTGYAGVLMASKLKKDPIPVHGLIGEDPDIQEPRYMSLSFDYPPMIINGLYAPFNNPENKNSSERLEKFYSMLMPVLTKQIAKAKATKTAVILAGDLQVAPTAMDQTTNADPNGPGSTQLERDYFNGMINLGLTDSFRQLHPDKEAYTAHACYAASPSQSNPFVQKRIDHVLITKNVIPKSVAIDKTIRTYSDHSAVIATITIPMTAAQAVQLDTSIASPTVPTLPPTKSKPPDLISSSDEDEDDDADRERHIFLDDVIAADPTTTVPLDTSTATATIPTLVPSDLPNLDDPSDDEDSDDEDQHNNASTNEPVIYAVGAKSEPYDHWRHRTLAQKRKTERDERQKQYLYDKYLYTPGKKSINVLEETIDFNTMKTISTNIALAIMQTKEYKTKCTKKGNYRFPEELRDPINPTSPDDDGTFEGDLLNLSNLYIHQDEQIKTKPKFKKKPKQKQSRKNFGIYGNPKLKKDTKDKAYIEKLWNNLNKVVPEHTMEEPDEAELNVLYSERQKLVDKVLAGNIKDPPPHEDVPEDDNVPLPDLPALLHEAVKDLDLNETRKAYVQQIPKQLHADLLNDKEWIKLMLSEKALATWGEPFDGNKGGITGIPPLELTAR